MMHRRDCHRTKVLSLVLVTGYVLVAVAGNSCLMPPGRMLKEDAVAVGVLEGGTALVLVGVVRAHRRVVLGLHTLARGMPRS